MFKTITFILFSFLLLGSSDNSHATEPSPNYVGSQKCASCHAQEHKAWQNSHHDLAMQPATEETVAGDFNNTTFNYFGTVSEFFKKDDLFFVRTDGPDGKLTEYPIAYTFGLANPTGKRWHDMVKAGTGYDAFLEWGRDQTDKIKEPKMMQKVWAMATENADNYYHHWSGASLYLAHLVYTKKLKETTGSCGG